jgi:magnesium chelatase family protein
VEYEKPSDDRLGEKSSVVQARMEAARQIQLERFAGSDLLCNAGMRPTEIREHCRLDETGKTLMRTTMNRMRLSARAYHRVLKLART